MRENKALGILFSNMHDSILGELTELRTTGSVPYGGRYRLIDFALSSMVNSDIMDIGIITKSNYQSLMDHVGAGRAYDLARKRGGLRILPPFASTNASGIYRGRLEALTNATEFIRRNDAKYVVLGDCDLIANIDLRQVINQHIHTGAYATLVYKKEEVFPEDIRDTIVLGIEEQTDNIIDIRHHPDVKGEQNVFLNLAVFEKNVLEKIISDGKSHGHYSMMRSVLQPGIGKLNLKGYEFTGYSHKISSMKSYFAANMELLDLEVRTALFPKNKPIYTKVRDQVPVKYGLNAQVSNSLIADGCVIHGKVENCVVFRGTKVGRGATIKNCIVMQNTIIGDNAYLEYVITDKDVLISDSRTLVGYETYPTYITKGSRV